MPISAAEHGRRVRIVFCGDSLTEGVDGASYLRELRRRAQADPRLAGIELINAGVGGDTVFNLARRLARDVVPHQPDWVVIFVGVNDCSTYLLSRSLPTLSSYRSRRYFRRDKGVRQPITPERFRDGLRILVEGIRARTPALIALCTPATIDESLHSRAWHVLDRYATMARLVASERGCPLIDIHAALAHELAALPERPLLARLAAVRARWLRDAGIETQARARGYVLTYDGCHLTARGAALVASVFEEWLSGITASAAGSVPRS